MASKKNDLMSADPLGALISADKGVVDDSEDPADDEGLGAAQALLDAIHAKDAAGVRDAFSAMSLSMKPPGEDDMNMMPEGEEAGPPSSEPGGLGGY